MYLARLTAPGTSSGSSRGVQLMCAVTSIGLLKLERHLGDGVVAQIPHLPASILVPASAYPEDVKRLLCRCPWTQAMLSDKR